MKTRAAVAFEAKKPLEIVELDLEGPKAGEVLVEIMATGICHTDAYTLDGFDSEGIFPSVLGHEGAGIVREVGAGVTSVKPGDHVIPLYTPECRQCKSCLSGKTNLCTAIRGTQGKGLMPDGTTRFSYKGQPIFHYMGCSTFSNFTVLPEIAVAKIREDAPFQSSCYIGCGVTTGVGAVVNTAKLTAGSIAVVFGAGGVGLNAIQGCAIAGAAMVIAVDRSDHKLAMARLFGATHTVNAAAEDNLVKTLKKLTGGGADYAFECVGLGSVVAQAYGALRKGGTAVVVGVAGMQDTTTLKTVSLTLEEKTLKGSYYGSARPREDFPRLMSLYSSGKLKLDELITHRYTLAEAPQAFDDLAQGRNARGMIIF